MHGDKLVSGSFDNTIKDQSMEHQHLGMRAHPQRPHYCHVHSLLVHGDKLLSGSDDHTIKVWSTDTWLYERTKVTRLFILWQYGDKPQAAQHPVMAQPE
jgi:WD40 repeat protein